MPRLFPLHRALPGWLAMALPILVPACDSARHEEPPASPDQQAEAPGGKQPESSWKPMTGLAEGRWQPIDGAAEVAWDEAEGLLRIGTGYDLNGVRWTGKTPVVPYLVELEARRVTGSDFFCGLTFPVRDGSQSVSLIVGGWGGNLIGISSIQGLDASENSTGSYREFEDGRWYALRIQVESERIRAWIDDVEVVDVHTEDQTLSLRPGPIEDCAPFGIATFSTTAELRGIRWMPAPPSPERDGAISP